MFDAEKARTALGEGYGPWLAECARNLPTAPEDSLEYSKKVAEAFMANLSGVGLVYDLTGAPGVLAAGPEALLKRFYGNFGMVDVAVRILVERLTPKVTAGEAALLCEYLGKVSDTERDDLCLRAIERLGIWDPSTPITLDPSNVLDTALTVTAKRGDVTTEQRARIDTLAGKAERKQHREDKARTGPPIADLRSMDLRGCDLSGADLTGVNFTGTDLSNADLSGADLRGVDLGGVLRGSGINFSGANLSGVNFSPKNRADSNASDLLDDFRDT